MLTLAYFLLYYFCNFVYVHLQAADSHESKSRTNRRSSFNAPNSNHSSYTWPGDDPNSAAVSKRNVDFTKAFGSTTCDNGLAVTISSMRPGINDIRRASWSLFDKNEPKTIPTGYSTKINFGKEGVTVIADTKSRKHCTENVPPKSTGEYCFYLICTCFPRNNRFSFLFLLLKRFIFFGYGVFGIFLLLKTALSCLRYASYFFWFAVIDMSFISYIDNAII